MRRPSLGISTRVIVVCGAALPYTFLLTAALRLPLVCIRFICLVICLHLLSSSRRFHFSEIPESFFPFITEERKNQNFSFFSQEVVLSKIWKSAQQRPAGRCLDGDISPDKILERVTPQLMAEVRASWPCV
jgi:hypothetical protein